MMRRRRRTHGLQLRSCVPVCDRSNRDIPSLKLKLSRAVSTIQTQNRQLGNLLGQTRLFNSEWRLTWLSASPR